MNEVVKLSTQETIDLADDVHFKKQLVTEDKCWTGVDWRPLKKTADNIRYLGLQNHFCGTLNKNVQTSDGKWSAISFSTAIKVPYGVLCEICIHCKDTNDLLAHVVRHLQHLATIVTSSTPTAFVLFFAKFLDGKRVVDFLGSDFGCLHQSENLPTNQCIIVDRRLSSKL